MTGVILSLLVTIFMVRYLLKHFRPQFLLFAAIGMQQLGFIDAAGILPKKVASIG